MKPRLLLLPLSRLYVPTGLFTACTAASVPASSFIIGLLNAGRNLAIEVMGNTAKLYGFDSLKEAEQKQGNGHPVQKCF